VEVAKAQQIGDREALKASSVVRVARRLSANQLRILGITDFQLDVADLFFGAIQMLLDDRDPRPMEDRLEDLEERAQEIFGPLDEGHLEIGEAEVPRWLRQASAPVYGRFMRRFLGAAGTHQLISAFREDGEVLAVAVRRCLRYLLPVAAAADRCIRVLSPRQQAEIDGLEALASSTALGLVVKLDLMITEFETNGVHLDPGVARPSELVDLPGPVGEVARSVDPQVSDQSAEILQDLGSMLTRKVRGARDALAYSSDPISQAANSIIELVDRMLRNAFDTDDVLEWIDSHFPSRSTQLTHVKQGRREPTKRAQALCFAFAGEAPQEHPLFHELAAAAIIAARNGLERLKHADHGTEDEKQELIGHLQAVEGSIVLVSRIAWVGAEESSLQDLRHRLAIAA